MKEKLAKILVFFWVVFTALGLAFALRGNAGNPGSEILNNPQWKDEGPFELSPERGRYALLYSVVEDSSLYFSTDIARFVTPDLGYINNHYVSLFAPGVSFLVAPGYLLGRIFGLAQVGTFAFVSLFAFFNAILIMLISKRLGANKFSGILASLIFLFSTPAFAYGVTLYQHHITTFIMLGSIYILLSKKTSLFKLFLVWTVLGFSLSVDYPNFLLLSPIGLWLLSKGITFIEKKKKIQIKLKFKRLFTSLALMLPLLFFAWFNYSSYGNPLKLAGTVASIQDIDDNSQPVFSKIVDGQSVPNEDKTAVAFFATKNITRGLYVHLFSLDRGLLIYSPILLFSIFGAFELYKKKPKKLQYLLMLLGVNLLLYSMWGDPWGGWAFGSRYLIPGYAILSIFMAFSLSLINKYVFMFPIVLILISYSLFVNTLGAVTSSKNPPRIEAVELEKISGRREPYTFLRNLEYIHSGGSKSFIFRTYLSKEMTAENYFFLLYYPLLIINSIYLLAVVFEPEK